MMYSRVNGRGGAICIDKNGNPGFGYNTKKMAWAIARPENPVLGGVHAPNSASL